MEHPRATIARRPLSLPLLCGCLALVTVLAATGCTDMYVDRYTPQQYGQTFAPVTEAQVIEVKNVDAQVVKDTDFPNATVVGHANFTLSAKPHGDPKALAESIGADVVVVSRSYEDTKRETNYESVPGTYSYRDSNGKWQSRTYTQKVPVTRNVAYYRYETLFLRTIGE